MRYVVNVPRDTTWFAISPFGAESGTTVVEGEAIRNMWTWVDILGNVELRRGYPPFLVAVEIAPIYGEDPGSWPDMLKADVPCVVVKRDGSMVRWDGAGDFEDVFVPAAVPGGIAVRFELLGDADVGIREDDLTGRALNVR